MELSTNGILTDLLSNRVAACKLGIVVRNIRQIDPIRIAETVAQVTNRQLAVAVVGYDLAGQTRGMPIEQGPENSTLNIASTIEAAVGWRNQASQYKGRILVFVSGDVDKLGSLHSLDTLTVRDLSLHLIAWAGTTTAQNAPQRRFWKALETIAPALPFAMLLEFTRAVANQSDNLSAITSELWRLGLLEDPALLNANADVSERLEHNRELITAIGQLSDKSRKRMNQVLQRSVDERQRELRTSALQLRKFFASGRLELLKGLKLDTVAQLIEAGRSESAPIPPPDSTDEDPGSLPAVKPERTLRGTELTATIAKSIVGGRNREAVAAYVERVRSQMNDAEDDNDDPVDDEPLRPLTGGRALITNVKAQTRTLRAFVASFCSEQYWGGVLEAEQQNLRDIVQRFEQGGKADPFDPNAAVANGQDLVSLLTNLGGLLDSRSGLRDAWDRLAAARNKLVSYLDLLIAEPIGLLYTDEEARTAMVRYLDAYADLLHLLDTNRGTFNAQSPDAYRAIVQAILRLDIVFAATPGDKPGDVDQRWKALLTPLHPLHLWRYRTILEKSGPDLTEPQQRQLASALPELPHLLHFVAVKNAKLGSITLPLAGALEGLPIYENRTNRYLGSDGTAFLGDMLRSWLNFAPYSHSHIRLALIDPPFLPDILREVKDFLRGRYDTNVVIDVYRTRPQNVFEHLAEMEFEGQDSAVAELLLSGQISLNLYACDTLSDAVKQIADRPVHITYSFDQSAYDLTKSSRHRHLVVSPLVITYQYTFDEVLKKGSIAPSSDADSGLFADYHSLVNMAIDLQEDQSFHVQIGSGADVGALNGLLRSQGTRWLAVADRTLLGYAPLEGIPLTEQLHGRREVAVWDHATSRSVSQFAVMLRERYNLVPDEEHLVGLMRQFGHIGAGGLFTTVRTSNLTVAQRDKQRKGLIGTILAAHWYTTQHPGALIASLDSGLARQWLALQAVNHERADLIGLRQDERGDLSIDIIEVKAVEIPQREVQVHSTGSNRQVTLTGPAVNQLRATLDMVTPIFFKDSAQLDLFGQARLEALKYQLYRECYRELHNDADQSRWNKLLNAAFRGSFLPAKPNTNCHGLVIHLSFEENAPDEIYHDSNGDMTLVRLRSPSIQTLLTSQPIRPPDPDATGTPSLPTGFAQTSTKQVIPQPHDEPAKTEIPADRPTVQSDAASEPVSSFQNMEPPPASQSIPRQNTLGAAGDTTGTPIAFDILLGDTKATRQHGVLGRVGNRTVVLDLDGTNIISIFGVQGGGKSYTVGSIIEMATQSFEGVNMLPSPLASIVFHYHGSQDYPPEFVSMVAPNSRDEEIRALHQEYGANPGRLDDVVILTSPDKVLDRQAEFPFLRVEPILFGSGELTIRDWQFLMGVFGDQMYMKQVTMIMRRLRPNLTLSTLRVEIEQSSLNDSQKALVNTRLDFAEQFIDDRYRLSDVLRRGQLVIVDLRDELITKEEALGLFVVMLNIFANAGRDQGFNKLIVFDEAHKYMDDDDLAGYIVEVVRQMRHQGVSVLIASQDPPSLPNAIIELSTMVILHRFNSPKWLRHVQQSITALNDLQPDQMAGLMPGEAYVWAAKSTDRNFMRHSVKMRFRPRLTQHGGETRTATQT